MTPLQGSERFLWECEKCGDLSTEPSEHHRHAEGRAALGVYYSRRRLTVRVVDIADVKWNGRKYVHTPRVA